jgi:hypothetical protein
LHDSVDRGIVGRGHRLHDPQTHVARLISVRISWKNLQQKKIEILEDFKRNTKQAVAGSVQQTLRKFPRYSVKWVNVFLDESGENF